MHFFVEQQIEPNKLVQPTALRAVADERRSAKEMSETQDNLPDRAGARFVMGASYTGIVVFIVVMLYSSKWKEGLLDA